MDIFPRFLLIGVIFSFVCMLVLITTPSFAKIDCGATIGPNQKAKLTKDLECSGPGDPALTVRGGSVLNLGGHTIDCVNRDRNGIKIIGRGSILKHGIVRRCQAGVSLTDEGHHLVTKVTSTLNTHGFEIFSGKGNI